MITEALLIQNAQCYAGSYSPVFPLVGLTAALLVSRLRPDRKNQDVTWEREWLENIHSLLQYTVSASIFISLWPRNWYISAVILLSFSRVKSTGETLINYQILSVLIITVYWLWGVTLDDRNVLAWARHGPTELYQLFAGFNMGKIFDESRFCIRERMGVASITTAVLLTVGFSWQPVYAHMCTLATYHAAQWGSFASYSLVSQASAIILWNNGDTYGFINTATACVAGLILNLAEPEVGFQVTICIAFGATVIGLFSSRPEDNQNTCGQGTKGI